MLERIGYKVSISIHALRKESDSMTVFFSTRTTNFNPRSP